MKKIVVCICLTLVVAAAGFGQKQKKDPEVVDIDRTEPSKKNPASDSSSDKGILLDSGTSIEGQLLSSVDVKKAKVGDQVVLKTTKSIKQNGETVVPKGAKLIGRVTQVQQKTKSNGASKLGMVFESLVSEGMVSPINASITSISNVASRSQLGNTASSDLFGSSSTSTQTSGGSSGGGGLLGGAGNTVGGLAGTAGGVLNTTTQTLGDVTNTAGQTLGTTTSMVGQTVNGIQISNAVNGSAQSGSTLSTANKNIRLEKGVTLQLTLNSSVQQQ